MLVEKKIAVINKWLDRLVKSYKSGAMENALIEAECAKADLEDLRQDVWAKVIKPAKKSGFSFSAFNFNVMPKSFSGVLILSALIVMLMVVPLKKDGKIIGVLDLDSPKVNRFEAIADIIEKTAQEIENCL